MTNIFDILGYNNGLLQYLRHLGMIFKKLDGRLGGLSCIALLPQLMEL